MTFAEAWAVADRIPGWFVEGEGELLYRLALEVSSEECIVEVGSYLGRSAALLAATGRPTYLVDPLALGDVVGGRSTTADDLAGFTEFVAARDNVTFWNMTTDACPDPREQIGLLFIDGCHVGPWPLADFKRFEHLLAPGARVLFHDVGDAPAVRRTVDDLCAVERLEPLARAAALAAFTFRRTDA